MLRAFVGVVTRAVVDAVLVDVAWIITGIAIARISRQPSIIAIPSLKNLFIFLPL